MTEDEAVAALAEEAGLEGHWIDAWGAPQTVGIATLRAVLAALDLPAGSRKEIEDSRARLRREKERLPQLIVARRGETIVLDNGIFAELETEDGVRSPVRLRQAPDGRLAFRAPQQIGYYRIHSAERHIALAVTPTRALLPKDIVPKNLAGISVQIHSLRGGTSGGFGDFAALGSFARAAGRAGFNAIMASPVHALFGAAPGHFSPYSPSTRLFFNPLFADVTLAGGAKLETPLGENSLIDWKIAGPNKSRALRHTFARFRRTGASGHFEKFCRDGGERLLNHTVFETLDAHFRQQGVQGFRHWPAGFESPAAANVSAFAMENHKEVEYQLFLQWLAARSAEAAQKQARRTMAVGIVADLAVGMDPEGSHAWSAPEELLRGLHVGAPPDAFNTDGQDWGLTALSPRALKTLGYLPFIATLRAAVRYADGLRIDHAMGLRRLWVVPDGASPKDGAYLRFPEKELLRLIALESHRNRAIVIGEDLGTVPPGFRAALARAGVLGTQVLWFKRNDRNFANPSAWRADAIATTTTHDLPTVAGWWSERDIACRKQLDRLHNDKGERKQRAADRALLWTALRNAHCVTGNMPSPQNSERAVTGALAYIGRTRSPIAFAPLEDLLADPEQPNLPGTIDEHPNWRRRTKQGNPFRNKAARKRMQVFLAARRRL